MEQRIRHTPEGVRDIYGIECKKKSILQKELHAVLQTYGYEDIQTPMFEFFDVFSKDIGTIPSKELYKFFDREGNTLVLRPDITPSIARAAATLCEEEEQALRLCYLGNTFINQASYIGRASEITQLGAELIGDDTIAADAEVIALVVTALQKAGLSEFQIMIGNVDFFSNMLKETGLSEEDLQRLRELIGNRNYFAVGELLDELAVPASVKKAFQKLPDLVGDVDILETALLVAPNEAAKEAIKRLQELHTLLQYYQVDSFISYDLNMSGTYGYYTGIIFRGYTYGLGDAIVRGGRYDHLVEKFGTKVPSIGFVFVIDDVMSALNRQKIEIDLGELSTLVLYETNRLQEAVVIAQDLRKKGKQVTLLERAEHIELEDYIGYGQRHHAGTIMYLEEDGGLRLVNLMTMEEHTWGNKGE